MNPNPPAPTGDAAPEPGWWNDLAEVDRYLDGELPAPEHAARRAGLEADAEARKAVEARGRFHAALQAAGALHRSARPDRVPGGLERRILTALAEAPRSGVRRRWPAFAAAAVVLLGLGLAVLLADGDPVTADPMPLEVLQARDALETVPDGIGGCRQQGVATPHAFPSVQQGELDVTGCEERADGTVLGRLGSLRDTTVAGFVARAEPGTKKSHRIGRTELGGVVVYDVRYGDATAYIAAKKSVVAEKGSCFVCHNRSRDGKKNPHDIVRRTWTR